MSRQHVVILGNGITGITVARHIRKHSDDRITVVSGESDHHFSRTALMYIYMGDLTYSDTKAYEDEFWPKNRIELKRAWVERIETTGKKLIFDDGAALDYDSLIVATGSKPVRFGWPGQDLDGVQSLYSIQDVELMEKASARTKRTVIVGGGLIGVEVAEMLASRGIEVVFLVREANFWGTVLPEGEAKLVAREIHRHGIDLRPNSELREILPDALRRVRAVVTKAGEEIPCEMVFLTTGVAPNIAVAKAAGIECDRGVLVDPFFRTSVVDVYSGGDCAQHRVVPTGRRPVEQVWYTGRIHGEHIAANLCGKLQPYAPGIWFNSAKFFDIEYQTYGIVLPKLAEGEASFYWEHPEGNKCCRINFDQATGSVLGVNVFGLRQRHEVWEAWIAKRTPIQEVMRDLAAANFDPEFYRQYEASIIASFNAAYPGHTVELRTKKGLFSGFMKQFKKPVH